MSDETQEAVKPKTYSGVCKEQPVYITDKDGVTNKYIQRQLTGALRDAQLEFQRQHFRKTAEGGTEVTNFIDLNASTVAKGLFYEDGKPVPITVIRNFPDSTVEGLARDIDALSEIGKEGIEKAKNE